MSIWDERYAGEDYFYGAEPMLRAAFADMEILHLREHDDFISEGVGHRGMSALIDLVARKPAG